MLTVDSYRDNKSDSSVSCVTKEHTASMREIVYFWRAIIFFTFLVLSWDAMPVDLSRVTLVGAADRLWVPQCQNMFCESVWRL